MSGAFGCVLYEMLTGKRAFDGEDVAATIAKILEREPDWDAVPHQVRRLIRQCLQKDHRKRLRDIGDGELLLGFGEAIPPPAPRVRAWGGYATITILSLMALAGSAIAVVHFRETGSTPPLLRFQVPPLSGTNVIHKFALSPDGRKIAFFALGTANGGQGTIFVRSFDAVEPRRVVDTVASPSISWSPDGKFLLYSGGGTLNTLFKVEASGGSPQIVCTTLFSIIGMAWTKEGEILFGVAPGGIWRVSAQGGTPTAVTTLDVGRQETLHSTPVLLPDGKHFLYLRSAVSAENSGIYVGAIDVPPQQQSSTRLIPTTLTAAFVSSPASRTHGFILFRRGEALLAQGFDVGQLTLEGMATTVADHVGNFLQFGNADVAGSALAYRSGSLDLNRMGYFQLTWFDASGKPGSPVAGPDLFGSIAVDPTGTRIVVTRVDQSLRSSGTPTTDIRTYDRDGRTSLITSEGVMNGFPVWSPTGEKIAYVRSFGTGMNMDIVTQSSNGSGTPAVVLPAPGLRALQDWSIRGDLLYVDLTSGKGDLFTLPLTSASPTPSPYLQTPFNESQARFSPDGNWVAYESDETGKPQVYVRPFPIPPGGGPKRTISINGGTQPRWSRDGKTLYYLGSNPDSVMAVNVRSPPIFSYHAPKRLFDAPRQEPPGDTSPMATWDVAPSGLGFVLTTAAAPDVTQQTPLSVVMNWFGLVK